MFTPFNNILRLNLSHMDSNVKEFNEYRSRMNERIMASDNLVIKRLFNLDANTYSEGALPVKTKEMLGLVASMVLRCDDCIKYHLQKCHEEGVTTDEVYEVFAIDLLAHLQRVAAIGKNRSLFG